MTSRYEIAPGEQICDLDCDLEALPAWGRLCVSELGVRLMANCLGIEIPEDNVMEANAKLREENRDLRVQNTKLRQAIGKVMDVAALVNLAQLVYDTPVEELESVP